MHPTQLSLTVFVFFIVGQWSDCQAGHLGLHQSALSLDDGGEKTAPKSGLADPERQQPLEGAQNFLERANSKFIAGVSDGKDVRNDVERGDGQAEKLGEVKGEELFVTDQPEDGVTGWFEVLTTEDTREEVTGHTDGVTEAFSETTESSYTTTEMYDVTENTDVTDDVTASTYATDDVTVSTIATDDVTESTVLTTDVTESYDVTEGQDEFGDVTTESADVPVTESQAEESTRRETELEGEEAEKNGEEEEEEEEEVEEEEEEEEADEAGERNAKYLKHSRRRGNTKKWRTPYDDNEMDTSRGDEEEDEKRKKKMYLDEALRKKMQDSSSFLMDAPDLEMEDDEDDLEILEAVVTSMAQWELNQLQKKLSGKRRVKRDEEVVCYKDLGCFRDEGPFDYLDMLPSPPEEINTRFLLYTRELPEREKLITYQNITTIIDSNFNISRPTKMLIHGFGSSCYSMWIREMRKVLLSEMDVNIICVNWQKGAEVPNYVRAASNTRLVGRQVAVLIETMNAYLNTTLDDFHLIGFSLGAHVSGHAGARLKNLSRISGLDPAGPLFESYSPSVRLDLTDAKMVDVIHTNADSLLMGGLGAFEPMGHVDFYPNGGRMQKGCANLFVGGVSDILWPTEGGGRYLCNHRRGYEYYLFSFSAKCKFPSFVCRDYETFLRGDCFPCEKCGSMGYFADQAEGRGQLYLVTSDSLPYCGNQYKVTVRHSGGPPAEPVTTYGRIDITFIAPDGMNHTLQLTRTDDEAMEAGGQTVRILVPHPVISEVSGIQLRYTAYKGWIYTGFSRWAIDYILIMDSYGKSQSFCNRGTTLVSEKTMQFSLLPGECPSREAPPSPAAPATPWPPADPATQMGGDDQQKESDNEVRPVPPLRLAVAQRVKPQRNITHDGTLGGLNRTQVVSAPVVEYFPGAARPHESNTGLLPITLEVPPNYQEIPHGFYSTIVSQQTPQHLKPQEPRLPPLLSPPGSPPDATRYSGPRITSPPSSSSDVAVSSEDPVSVIPAPDLAGTRIHHNVSDIMHPPPPPIRPAPAVAEHAIFHAVNSGEKEKNESSNFQVFVTLPTTSTSTALSSNAGLVSQTEQSPPNVTTASDSLSQIAFTTGATLGSTFSTRTNNPFPVTSTKADQLISGISSPAPLTDSPQGDSAIRTETTQQHTTPGIQEFKNPWLSPSTTTRKPEKSVLKPQGLDGSPQFIKQVDGLHSFHQDGLFFHPLDRSPSFQADSSLSDGIHGLVDTNSVIDGEVPLRERARALSLGPLPANVVGRQQDAAEEKSDCPDPSSCLIVETGSSQPASNRESSSFDSTHTPPPPPPLPPSPQRPVWLSHADSPQRAFPSVADAPPRPAPLPPGHSTALRVPGRTPPLETIVGRGRALQPLLLPSRTDSATQQNQHQQRHQVLPPQQQLQRQQQFSVSQQQQQQRVPPPQYQTLQYPDQENEPSQQKPVLVSAGNVTHLTSELSDRSQRPVPAPAPFYVQILPPSFSHLPHLETFSLPRDPRKGQQDTRKRGNVAARSNRGRSLSMPAPGGRAAVFTPLLLQLQDDHRGRYIPLRPLGDPPVVT